MVLSAQDSTQKPFQFSAYAEGYYAYDFGRPADNTKPPFFYSYNRHNAPRINIAMVRGSYTRDRFYVNAGMMAGTYSSANLARENGVLKNIYELNAGVKLAKGLWLQGGVMPSHIGFESAIGADCWNLTRSIMADNSPYVETGVKLGLERGKWYAALLVLNGWQRIGIPAGGLPLSVGHQLQYKPSGQLLFNSSSFIGTDYPPAERRMRYFHNFYATWQLSEKLGLQGALDVGAEQKSKGSSNYHFWYTYVLGARYAAGSKWFLAFRGEYFQDRGGVLVISDTGLPFSSFGSSINVDHQIARGLLFRLEGRILFSGDEVYLREGMQSRSNLAITAGLAWKWR